MKISVRKGEFGLWHDYEVILPGNFFVFNAGYEGFNIVVKTGSGDRYVLRIVERYPLYVKYMGRFYDMTNPKKYLELKSVLEAEIALASLK